MSLGDLLNRITGDVLRGDLQGTLGDLGLTQPTAGQAGQSGMSGGVQIGGQIGGMQGVPGISAGIGTVSKTSHPGDTLNKGTDSGQKCCNRFSFSNGFLVDGLIGRVWQLNTATNSLDEIPLSHNNPKQKLFESMIETKLSAIRATYEVEELSTVPPPKRAALLTQFDKDHLDPIRQAVQATAY
jgi:hypothetical protein